MKKFISILLALGLLVGTAPVLNSQTRIHRSTLGQAQEVEGDEAEGSGALPNPVLIGGDDGTDITNVAVDTDGHLQVDVLTAASTTDYIDDTATHSTGVTVVTGIGAVAVPTDGSLDANDIGMPAMSLDRRMHIDSDIAIDGTSITGGAGAVGASTPRITVASDDPLLVALQSVIYNEDVLHADADPGLAVWGVRNETLVNLPSTGEGDYHPFATDRTGAIFGVAVFNPNMADPLQIAKREDLPLAADDAGNTILVQRLDTLVAGAGVDTDGDATFLKVNNFSALWTALTDAAGAFVDPSAIAVVGGGLEATALRVTLASDSTGVLSVDDNGVALTVDWAGTAPPIGGGLEATALRVTIASDSSGSVSVSGFAMGELGITELIGINEQVDASEYSASVASTLTGTGEIIKVCLIATEDGSGVVLTPAGSLIIFDADPATTAGDASITNAERLTILGQFAVATADYQSDANGASICFPLAEAYHDATLFAAFFLNAAETSFNSAAGDDEQLEFNVWFRRDT